MKSQKKSSVMIPLRIFSLKKNSYLQKHNCATHTFKLWRNKQFIGSLTQISVLSQDFPDFYIQII